MRRVIFLFLLVSYGFRSTGSLPFPFRIFHFDGRYCFATVEADKTQGSMCNYSINIQTKYPYVIASFSLGEVDESEHKINIAKPTFWPEVSQQQPGNTTIKFALENVCYHFPSKLPSPLKAFHNCNSTNHFVIYGNGTLILSVDCPSQPQAHFILHRVESHSLERMIREHLCDVDNALPGSWGIDQSFRNSDEDKWSTCPNSHKNRNRLYHCPTPYYAAQYYPHSGCYILPLRLSLYLLYHYFERNDILSRSNYAIQMKSPYYNPYYTFIGDSLNGQIMEAGNCELENHDNSLSIRKDAINRNNLASDITIKSSWNQYLRNDYPCQPQCLTNQTFADTDGKISARSYLPPPCKGCSNHIKMTGKIYDHPEAFDYLQKIPKETRIVVINGGAWFSEYFLVRNGTNVFRETLEALLPLLAKLQRERNYNLDLYFLTLPGVDPATAKKSSFGWQDYEKRNRIISKVFSAASTARYNVTVTLIQNDQFFMDRRKKVDGYMISTPDRLHYCVPGVFSPPSFLFEVILHFHVRNRLKQEGLTLLGPPIPRQTRL